MAATTRAITPTHNLPFASNGRSSDATSLTAISQAGVRSLAPLAASAANALGASTSPRSQNMSPRVSSPPPASNAEGHPKDPQSPRESPKSAAAALSGLVGTTESAVKAAKEATTKLSQPLAAAAKSISAPENGAGSAQISPASVSSFSSIGATTAPATTAPAMASALHPALERGQEAEGSNAGRATVDPGISGASDGPRAFTYPMPLDHMGEEPHPEMMRSSGSQYQDPMDIADPTQRKIYRANRKHKCPYCSTEFTRHHNLKSHLLTHSQEKPYECMDCNARFRRLHDLKRHMKLHTGERPHECRQCGRKFARGDALARHTKGPGGCAGRRSSFGVDEDGNPSRSGDAMDGVEYTAEPEHMNDEEMADARASSKKARTDSYRHPSTYPPLPGAGGPPMYSVPPPRSRDPSISSQGPLSSIQNYNAGAPGSFSGMTESPKAISPGQSGDPRGNMSGPPRPQQSYGSSGRGNSPLGLPPPHMSGAPQLPAIHGFPPPSLPGSLSSHNSSAASTREILGAGAQQEHLWATIRDLKSQANRTQEEHSATVARMRTDYNRMDEEYQKRIEALNREIAKLRGGGKEGEESVVDSRLK